MTLLTLCLILVPSFLGYAGVQPQSLHLTAVEVVESQFSRGVGVPQEWPEA